MKTDLCSATHRLLTAARREPGQLHATDVRQFKHACEWATLSTHDRFCVRRSVFMIFKNDLERGGTDPILSKAYRAPCKGAIKKALPVPAAVVKHAANLRAVQVMADAALAGCGHTLDHDARAVESMQTLLSAGRCYDNYCEPSWFSRTPTMQWCAKRSKQ